MNRSRRRRHCSHRRCNNVVVVIASVCEPWVFSLFGASRFDERAQYAGACNKVGAEPWYTTMATTKFAQTAGADDVP